jgi:hypothetical protein
MKYLRTIPILISILVLVAAGAAGCKSSVTYAAATATKSGISFSFEYPAGYVPQNENTFADTGNNSVVALLYYDNRPDKLKIDREIVIGGFNPLPDRPDASIWTDVNIKVLRQADSKFKLYERSTIQVSGIEGETTTYHTSVMPSFTNSDDVVYRDAYIDYRGKVWKITVLATADVADEAKPDFELLITSFKFLN